MKKQMLKDRNLKKRIDRVAEKITKSQEQTPVQKDVPVIPEGSA